MEEGEARRGGGGPHAARAYYLAGGCVDPPPLYPILFSSLFPCFSFTFFASLRGYPPRSVPGFLNSDWIQLWSFGNRLFDYRIVMSGNHNKNGTMISPDKLFFDSPIELRLRSDSKGELIRVISTIAADVIGERELLEELVEERGGKIGAIVSRERWRPTSSWLVATERFRCEQDKMASRKARTAV